MRRVDAGRWLGPACESLIACMPVVADRAHRCGHSLPPCPCSWRPPLPRTAEGHCGPLGREALQPLKRFVQVPNWYAAKRPGSCRQQRIVRCFISFDHIGDQRPVEPRVAVPVLHPASVTVHIKSAALVPDRESAIVEHERLANPETIPMSSLRGKGTSAWRPARNLTPSWRVPPTGVPW